MLLKMNPSDRYTAEQAVNHTWIKDNASKGEAAPAADTHFIANLRGFRTECKFKKVALQAIASHLGEAQIKNLSDTFLALDTNGNGTLTISEVKEGIEKAGLKEIPPDLKELMNAAGEIERGESTATLDYTEFLAATLD